MKDTQPNKDRPGAGAGAERQDRPQEAQPWHAADEKPRSPEAGPGGAPLGTHSLTGAGANVGIPQSPGAAEDAGGSRPREEPPGSQEPDPSLEPRASIADILARKP
jgi:hypothetical protein